MYALIIPALTPFVLLATVLALSWWEDHILPTLPAGPVEALAEAPFTPAVPAQFPQPPNVDAALTGGMPGVD
ncbi:hypothetical protein [Streptomyces sp. NBC_00005]|uniref:hypothetical protein n=1 Tax=Streptomyces sp. NBC_00005 TaxID=2903609 RepID=UPI00324B570E